MFERSLNAPLSSIKNSKIPEICRTQDHVQVKLWLKNSSLKRKVYTSELLVKNDERAIKR